VFRTKYELDGSVERHKASLVAKGFYQVEGIDYNETFSLIAKMNSIHLVLSLPASHKWEVNQMDAKIFLLECGFEITSLHGTNSCARYQI
jgi:hypothetical protein